MDWHTHSPDLNINEAVLGELHREKTLKVASIKSRALIILEEAWRTTPEEESQSCAEE